LNEHFPLEFCAKTVIGLQLVSIIFCCAALENLFQKKTNDADNDDELDGVKAATALRFGDRNHTDYTLCPQKTSTFLFFK